MFPREEKKSVSCNHWTYVPGKKVAIAPLNLKDIQRQLLDSDESDESDEDEQDTQKLISPAISPSRPVDETIPKEEGTPEEDDDDFYDQDTIKLPDSEVYNIACDSRNDVDQNSTNHCDKPSLKWQLETLSEELHDLDLSKELQAYTPSKALLLETNKENIPPKSTNLKIDDSFDLDFSSLMDSWITTRIPDSNSGYTHSAINTCLEPMLPPQVRSPVKKPNRTPLVTSKFKKPIIYTGPDGFNRIMVNSVEYIVYNVIGRGGSSEVYCGFNQGGGMYVAIKLVTLLGEDTSKGYINEVKLLESLQDCDRIVKMYDYEIKADKLVVVLEKGGEDFNTILKQLAIKKTRLPNYLVLFYWMEMLHAVKQIQAKGVIHSDLKPANFLRNEGGLKLIDFGIASKVQDDMTCAYKSHQEGTTNYMSPETLMAQENSGTKGAKYEIHFKTDVFSLGCILYQLVYGYTPFQHIKPMFTKLAAICNPNHEIDYPEAEWAPKTIIETIKKCLQFDVKARPSVDELIQEYEQLLKNL